MQFLNGIVFIMPQRIGNFNYFFKVFLTNLIIICTTFYSYSVHELMN